MNDIEKRTVLLSRELPFARERIWTAMTHPDHVVPPLAVLRSA